MQPTDVCRICGGKGLLLQISDQGNDYTEDIEDCLAVKVKADDGQSQEICHKCLGSLNLCKPYMTKVNLLKDNNAAPSSKKCYTCQSTKSHLFPFPDTSVDKLQEFFGLTVVKSKNSKICHECQYYLDCISDLREKANAANKLSRHGQDLKFMVKRKNATVDDLVCSLKEREVEVDESPRPRKTSRSVKSQIKSKGNGSANNNVEEGLSSKRRSGAKNSTNTITEDDESEGEVNTRKKSNRQSVKENNLSDNDSPARSTNESGSKRRRRLSRSSDSDLNTSVESSGKEMSLSESRWSSRDGNDSKQNEPSKRSSKTKDSKEKAESKPAQRFKRQKLSKHEEESEAGSDSDSDSTCLASFANTNVKDETSKKSGRNRNSVKTPVVKIVDLNTPQKKPLGRASRNAEAVKQKQPSRNWEGSRLTKRVHFEVELTNENKRKKQAEQSRKKMAEVSEESSEGEEAPVVESRRRKNPPLNAYTCTVCSDDFRSTVEGKEHELRHDERFNNFEIKLVRVLNSEIASSKSLVESTKNEDEDDDLWTVLSHTKQRKGEGTDKGDAFDALFDSEANDKSFTTKSSDSRDVACKSGDATFNNSSDSEVEDPNKDTSKSEKPIDSSETVKTEDSKSSKVEKPEEISDPKLSEDDKCTEKEESCEVEEKNEVSGEEKSECEKEEGKSDADDTGGSLNSTIAEPRNGAPDEKDDEGDHSKEEDAKPDESDEKATDEPVPEEKKSELNGTDDNAEGIDSQDKKEVNTSVCEESSLVKKSGCAESSETDVDPDNIKETISEKAE